MSVNIYFALCQNTYFALCLSIYLIWTNCPNLVPIFHPSLDENHDQFSTFFLAMINHLFSRHLFLFLEYSLLLDVLFLETLGFFENIDSQYLIDYFLHNFVQNLRLKAT